MIPIRDTTPSKNYPIVNIGLIGLNVFIFFVQMSQGPDLERFVYIYGLVPARYSVPQIASYFSIGQQLFSFISFMFLHGGFWHLLSNMWSLYIFGDNVEDHMGPLQYLLFYLLSGLASGLTHLYFNYHSNMPTIGASGAIAGVMGAYFVLHPTSRILTLVPIFFIPYFIEIPAFFFLGFWFVIQFINAAGTSGGMGGIAWWAHIGGFVFGILLLKLMDAMPVFQKISRTTLRITKKKTTHRLQMVRPVGSDKDPNLYGTIHISWYEALTGTRKLINIPWGFQKRLFRVTVPAGVKDGSLLRLRGMGKLMSDGSRGDILLKVVIDSGFQ
ncbi:MAG: rhomboid family intramembrane serine protease [Deltaproteobacteria bacterium]|nr:rhomboid family intramembrane serine protease [Deltaproteobacteria bacterium]MBW1960089.1 rhomboid family intramembrane serine protease [Deltaproteobacteria bacterium]MBW2153404.1 rhomboid family intramembrane serine protease [Deltaproteobacteria bacterium]